MKMRRAGLLALALLLAPAVRAAERTETLAVGGWHSKGDAYKTELALRGVKGVTNVSSDKDKGTVTVTYDDGTRSTFTQSLSDWYVPSNFPGESAAVAMPYRLAGNGQKDDRTFYLYAYSFDLDRSKVVRSLTLPDNQSTVVFAISLESSSP